MQADGLGKKGRTKAYPKVLEMIGRLREKYPRTPKRYDSVLAGHSLHTVEFKLRQCSNPEPEHRQIYQHLNLKEIPLPRK